MSWNLSGETNGAGRSGAAGAQHLDFLRPTQLDPVAPQLKRFSGVRLIWISLDSLVRNGTFQWVTADPGPFYFHAGPLLHKAARLRAHFAEQDALG